MFMKMAMHVVIFLINFLVGAILGADGGNQIGCDPGWTQHIDTCYMAVPVKQTWKMAQDICKTTTFGGNLAETRTSEIKAFVDGFLSKTFEKTFGNELFWLGGTDQYVEGNWIWSSTKSSFTFQSWWEHSTSKQNTSANCLAVGKPTLNKFIDERCENKHYFVCEKSVIQTTTAVPTTVQINNGYSHQFGGQQTRTTQDPDIDVNHELPVFVG